MMKSAVWSWCNNVTQNKHMMRLGATVAYCISTRQLIHTVRIWPSILEKPCTAATFLREPAPKISGVSCDRWRLSGWHPFLLQPYLRRSLALLSKARCRWLSNAWIHFSLSKQEHISVLVSYTLHYTFHNCSIPQQPLQRSVHIWMFLKFCYIHYLLRIMGR